MTQSQSCTRYNNKCTGVPCMRGKDISEYNRTFELSVINVHFAQKVRRPKVTKPNFPQKITRPNLTKQALKQKSSQN